MNLHHLTLLRVPAKAVTLSSSRFLSKLKLSTETRGYQPVIGLEIHAQIASKSKLFSGASTEYPGRTNNQVAFLDGSLPGTLPVLNRACVEAGVKTALALNCRLNMVSYFDRKHYFYADLPAGYQITQQRQPLGRDGRLLYVLGGEEKEAGIWQLQLEQDSGKSLHDATHGVSLIDLNRAGVGLMEIVTAPDFESGDEAAAFVKELQLLLRLLGTCDCKMEEGSLRVDASVSLHKPQEPLGVRSEVKNLNSVRFVKKAIEYEIQRQLDVLDQGMAVENETRSFDPNSGMTVAMRDKEKVHDYRFMPEPNLLPLRLYDRNTPGPEGSINIDDIREHLPLVPEARRRLLVERGLGMDNAAALVNEPSLWDVFTEVCRDSSRDPKIVCNTLLVDLMNMLRENKLSLENSEISTKQLGDVIDGLQNNSITTITARKVITECLTSPGVDVKQLIHDRGWEQITDSQKISAMCDRIMQENPHLVRLYRKKGKARQFNKLMSTFIETSEGLIEPAVIRQTLLHKLSEDDDDDAKS